MTTKNQLDNVMYHYTTNVDQVEEENRVLKETVTNLKRELDRFREPALMVCEVHEIFGRNAVIKVPNGNMFFVKMSDACGKIVAGDWVLVEQKNLTIVKKISTSKHFNVEKFVIIDKPNVSWNEIGGLDEQANEIKEVIELPLKKPELFKRIGITPPKGVLLYGDPGTGKTLLAKAVASSTKSVFIEIVGSELVQKFIGEGAKLVKDVFALARKKAPSIIFIDELDALAARRVDIGTSGEREVQRTFMQLLAEIDGFKPLGNVKIIGCTNRRDILDPAILRPGRLDRQIRVPVPDKDGCKTIFKIHTKNMSLDKNVNIDTLVDKMVHFSGAEIRAVCTEAGYFAIRASRTKVKNEDFVHAVTKVQQEEAAEGDDYMRMFG
ncbi:MAG: AAA family ATPase [archaeon]